VFRYHFRYHRVTCFVISFVISTFRVVSPRFFSAFSAFSASLAFLNSCRTGCSSTFRRSSTQRRTHRPLHGCYGAADRQEGEVAQAKSAPDTMRIRRQTVEHPFGTLKAWMGATHFLTKTLNRVSTEMSLHVMAYNLKRVIAILGVEPLVAAIRE
jgi:hypothetical protein